MGCQYDIKEKRKMVKKCFVLLMFGEQFPWTQKFIDHVQHLKKSNWYFQIYTPHDFKSEGNVTIIPMTIEEFNSLVEEKLGINPKLYITEKGIPSFHVTDFYVMLGKIFEDFLTDFDYWGTVGMDCVIGRLDHFLQDEELSKHDIWSDDKGQFNANFALYRNHPTVNERFKKITDWERAVTQTPCPGCLGTGSHQLRVTDEYGMTAVLLGNWGQPKYHLIHSHDRLENHVPVPKLQITEDGSLWELLADVAPRGRNFEIGREIAYFHFQMTKKWPLN